MNKYKLFALILVLFLFLVGCVPSSTLPERNFQEDLDHCNLLVNESKNTCFFETAIATKDEYICNKINYVSISLKDKIKYEGPYRYLSYTFDGVSICKAVVNHKLTICGSLNGEYSGNSCYTAIAEMYGDKNACEFISGDIDHFYLCLALATKNENYCLKIDSYSDRKDCLEKTK